MSTVIEPTGRSSGLDGVKPPSRRRRLWLLILFGIAAIIIFLGVTVLFSEKSPQFEFLKGSEKITESETILKNRLGIDRFNYHAFNMSEKKLAALAVEANKELLSKGWTPTTANKDTAGWRNAGHDTNLIMFAEGTRTRVWIIKSGPPTTLDKVRIWLKGRLPFLSPKSNPESPP